MKKFIISVLCVSVFFIGLGGLVEKAGAKFKSDAKALELIRQARVAIGGDANIKNVRSMTITGTTSHTLNLEGRTDVKQGSVEINFELPGKFGKMVRIGEPGDGAETAEFSRQFDVIATRKGDGTTEVKELGDGRKVVIVKDGDGKTLTEDVKPVEGERRIIIKKADAATGETKSGDEKEFILERKIGDGSGTWTTEDGKKIVVNKAVKVGEGEKGAARQNEMLQTTFALLLTTPDDAETEYLYAGDGNVDGFPTDVVEVKLLGSSFKIHLDKTSHLPRMLSYAGMPEMKVVRFNRDDDANAPKEDVKVFRTMKDKVEAVEHQIKFSDFRFVGGVQFPHRWTKTIGGNPAETIEITNYEINPANIGEKFQNRKVFVRQSKEQ